ncbi:MULTISPECIES: cytochrome P450 [Pseudonocardia]|nr:cytochrome P450 [Pseudonocardia abyssalis]
MIAQGLAGADPDAEQTLMEVLLTDHGAPGPYAGYRRLRERAPRLRTAAGLLVLSGYRDCEAALRNRALGKMDESLGFQLAAVPEDLRRQALRRFRRTMLFRNPPDHTRLRRLVSSVFTPRHVEALRPAVVRRIDALLDGFAGRDVLDVVTELALPLPVGVIGDLLGVPDIDLAVAAPWVRHLVAPLEPSADVAAVEAAVHAEDQLAAYVGDLLAEKRRRPGDDLLSRLATARGEDQLDDDECVGTAILLFAAGFETTTNLIGNGLAALLGAPVQAALLRERPGLAGHAVEEMLRFDAPVQTDGRTALVDTAVADVEVGAGQVVLMLLGAGNRDPEVYTDPDSLHITRRQAAPLSFGGGLHFCLGAPLARLEAVELFPRLLARFPELATAGTATWRPGLSFRGLARLPVAPGRPA